MNENAAGDESMKMLMGWKHSLSLGLAMLAGSSQALAGGPSVPGKPATNIGRGPEPSSQNAEQYMPMMAPPGMMGGMPTMGYGMMPNQLGMQPAGYMPQDVMPYAPEAYTGMYSGAYAEGYQSQAATSSCGCSSCSSGGGCDSPGGMPGSCPSCGGYGCGTCGGSGLFSGMGGGGFGSRLRNPLGCGQCGGAACGGAGCGPACGPFGGRLLGGGAGLIGLLMPYGEGGRCNQRWFDLSVGTIALARTSNDAPRAFSNLGVSGTTAGDNVVLSTSNLDLNKLQYGLDVTAALQVGPGANVEVTYFGLNRWNESATATQQNGVLLYSTFSDFGINPPNGFDDTDRSLTQTVSLISALHSGEVNYRRRWVGPDCWFQGSWLAGLRYFDLDETFGFQARGNNNNTAANNGLRFFDSTTQTRNAMTGFQVGGDVWMNVMPGFMIGVETKGGIFGNYAEVDSTVSANSLVTESLHASGGRTAYLGQLTASALYRLTYSWSVRGSYQLLYVDNVALGSENFIPTAPAGLGGPGRVVNLQNDGEVTYQGFGLSAEYLW